jgi:DNA-binding GntR family transcriptional regulator
MTTEASPRSGRERALGYLRTVVLCDPDMEGRFITEQEIADQIGVSRTPVREALLILSSEGLLQLVPQKGGYIPPLSSREIRELMELRGVIERHAADVLPSGERTANVMQAVLDEQRAIVAAVNSTGREFIELDRKFHQALVDAAGSALLSRTYDGLRERQVRVGIVALETERERRSSVCTEHDAIVKALRSGDATAARDAINAHLEVTLAALLSA